MYEAARTPADVISVQEKWLKQLEIEATQRKDESKTKANTLLPTLK